VAVREVLWPISILLSINLFFIWIRRLLKSKRKKKKFTCGGRGTPTTFKYWITNHHTIWQSSCISKICLWKIISHIVVNRQIIWQCWGNSLWYFWKVLIFRTNGSNKIGGYFPFCFTCNSTLMESSLIVEYVGLTAVARANGMVQGKFRCLLTR
jgi:hypothetical protein